MSDHLNKIETLHTRLIDSRDGYQHLRDRTESGDHYAGLGRVVENRQHYADRVRVELKAAGREIDDDGSILASAHRQFIGLRDMVGSGDAAMMDEALRGEDKLLDLHDEAIETTRSEPRWAFLAEQRAAIAGVVEEVRREVERERAA